MTNLAYAAANLTHIFNKTRNGLEVANSIEIEFTEGKKAPLTTTLIVLGVTLVIWLVCMLCFCQACMMHSVVCVCRLCKRARDHLYKRVNRQYATDFVVYPSVETEEPLREEDLRDPYNP